MDGHDVLPSPGAPFPVTMSPEAKVCVLTLRDRACLSYGPHMRAMRKKAKLLGHMWLYEIRSIFVELDNHHPDAKRKFHRVCIIGGINAADNRLILRNI